ncbi:helix-turn-helix domain-containing protein [Halobacillus aidingensis]
MNQAEFASKMGVQESTVSRWIRNEREMSFNKAVEASRLLNCHAEDLYDWIKVD